MNSHQNATPHTHTHSLALSLSLSLSPLSLSLSLARVKTQTTSTKLPPAQTEDYVSKLGTAIVTVPFSAHTKESRLLSAPLPPSPEGPTPAVLEVLLPTGSPGDWRGSGKVIFLNRHAEICTGE